MESVWTPTPPNRGDVKGYQIYRTPASTKVRAAIVSDEAVGVMLHFWKGRSVPCRGGDCEACENGHSPRWKGYVLIKAIDSPKVVIFEYTDRAWQAFHQFQQIHGSLRGGIINAQRIGRRVNGPLVVEFEDARYDQALLPMPSDLQAMLARIWEIRQQFLPGVGQAPDDAAPARELRLA